MRFLFACFFALFISNTLAAQTTQNQYVRIETSEGTCIVKLYNETLQHRRNFVRLVKSGFFNGTLFHRVVKDFMIQGGDPSSKTAAPDATLGGGRLNYTIPAEIRDSLFHKKGALAAARDDAPDKASSACQFYIVKGAVFTDSMLDKIEAEKPGHKIPEWQRKIYKTTGGAPSLDGDYTVFGEVVKGFEMIDAISKTRVNIDERPKTDVKMTITMLTPAEIADLEKL